jgi:transcriptional regulator with XRE-family HTH domain
MRTTRKTPKQPLDHEPEAVTYAREQAGLTVTQLAERCGVTKSLISEIEKGTRNATPAMIRKLAAALNCPRVILERKREPETRETPADSVLGVRDGERADQRGADTDEVPELRGASVRRSA